jgi:hypothetical protein
MVPGVQHLRLDHVAAIAYRPKILHELLPDGPLAGTEDALDILQDSNRRLVLAKVAQDTVNHTVARILCTKALASLAVRLAREAGKVDLAIRNLILLARSKPDVTGRLAKVGHRGREVRLQGFAAVLVHIAAEDVLDAFAEHISQSMASGIHASTVMADF